MINQNILLVSPREVNPTMGGIERVSDALAKALMQIGYKIVFLAIEKSSTSPYTPCTTQYFISEDSSKRYAQLIEIISEHQINVIINQGGLFHFIARKQLPDYIKIISVNHDAQYAIYKHLDMCWLRKWRWRRIVSKGLRKTAVESDKIVLFSKKFIPEYKFFYKDADERKFVIIPNFNSYPTPNTSTPKKKVVLFVGRLSFAKRPDYLLHIWQKIHKKHPDWTLKIVGEGDYSKEAKELAKRLDLTGYQFEGQQNPTPYYEEASIFCLTSAFESFGMVITEAMQHGVVPIAFNSYSTASEIITDKEDGFLVEPFNIDSYAQKLSLLMRNEDIRQKMAEKALENVQRFSHEAIVRKWIALLDTIKISTL